VPPIRIWIVFEVPDSVTRPVPSVHVELEPDVSQLPEAEIVPLVNEIEFVPASFIATSVAVIADVLAVSVPPPDTVRLAPPVMSFPEVVRAPVIDRALLTSTALLCVIVPETIRL